MIPKRIIQTSREKPSKKQLDDLLSFIGDGYEYYHFDDNEIKSFFIENKLEKYKNILHIFDSIQLGPNKTELFRYYYLYLNGGIFLDFDFYLCSELPDDLIEANFFAAVSNYTPGLIFNGCIGCEADSSIILNALDTMYSRDLNEINSNFHLSCSDLFNIIENSNVPNIYLLQEQYHAPGIAAVHFKDERTMGLHFYAAKTYPENFYQYINVTKSKISVFSYETKFGKIFLPSGIDSVYVKEKINFYINGFEPVLLFILNGLIENGIQKIYVTEFFSFSSLCSLGMLKIFGDQLSCFIFESEESSFRTANATLSYHFDRGYKVLDCKTLLSNGDSYKHFENQNVALITDWKQAKLNIAFMTEYFKYIKPSSILCVYSDDLNLSEFMNLLTPHGYNFLSYNKFNNVVVATLPPPVSQ